MRSVPRTNHQSQPDRARLVRELLDNVCAQRRLGRARRAGADCEASKYFTRESSFRADPVLWAFAFYRPWIALTATWPAADIEPLLGLTHRVFSVRKRTATADLAVARAAVGQPAVNVCLRTVAPRRGLDQLLDLARMGAPS